MKIAAVKPLSRSVHAATSVGRNRTYAFSIVILLPLQRGRCSRRFPNGTPHRTRGVFVQDIASLVP